MNDLKWLYVKNWFLRIIKLIYEFLYWRYCVLNVIIIIDVLIIMGDGDVIKKLVKGCCFLVILDYWERGKVWFIMFLFK